MKRERAIIVMVLVCIMNMVLLRIAYQIVDECPLLVYIMGVFSWIVGAAVNIYWKDRGRKY